jgi:hypothetical protein
VLSSVDLRTWVYCDAPNQGGAPLLNTVDANDNVVTQDFSGSRYRPYDSSVGEMRIDKELSGEQDTDDPAATQTFLEHALADCVANDHPIVWMKDK